MGKNIKLKANFLSALSYQIYCEMMKAIRIPAFVIPTMLFPIMFFAFFGLPNAKSSVYGVGATTYILISYGFYAVISLGMFTFGVSIASERGLGWYKLIRISPLNPFWFFLAKIVMSLIFGFFVLLALFIFGAITAQISLNLEIWIKIIFVTLANMIPFIALGLLIGYIGGPNSAVAIANLIFLPMSFASGLFIPLEVLPKIIKDIAQYLPIYHSAQLGWGLIGAGQGDTITHLLWLAAYTVVFLFLALIAYRRDQGKNFG